MALRSVSMCVRKDLPTCARDKQDAPVSGRYLRGVESTLKIKPSEYRASYERTLCWEGGATKSHSSLRCVNAATVTQKPGARVLRGAW
jgi:hypothetical protein